MAERRIYPMGLTRDAKAAVLAMVPEEQREEARKLLRTGEETAVIFAKVSRAAKGFEDIAAEVDEEGAAQFHSKWTVSVEGYGHASVGEHAPVQIAVENEASLDGDAITDNRLGSYTEFSARFKGRQDLSYFTPDSVVSDPELKGKWDEAHERLFTANDVLVERGKEWIEKQEAQERFPQVKQGHFKEGETENSWRVRLGKHTSDQFKNLLPASRLTSMGVTWNGTEAEHALTKLLSSTSASIRQIGQEMKTAALQVAPTLVKYADFNGFMSSLDKKRQKLTEGLNLKEDIPMGNYVGFPPDVIRINSTDHASVESAILAAFLFESIDTGTFFTLHTMISDLDEDARAAIFDIIFDEFGSHDRPPRAFEFDGGYIMEMPHMDYGCWRDYKRHRMQSYIAKPMHIKYGHMIPPMAIFMDESEDPRFHGSVDLVKEVVGRMEELFREVEKLDPIAAQYAVTRLHYRPAIARYNLREAFHLLKLRTASTAHPFVRDLMWGHVDALRNLHPNIIKHIQFRDERTEVPFP